MNYYAIGDTKYVVAHYGVPGMHWGVRRYQPYSVTGPRKGGKTGKEIGEANKLDNVKHKQIRKINKTYDKMNKAYSKTAEKLRRKGKNAKAAVFEYAVKQNEKERKQKIQNVNKFKTKSDFKRSRNQDVLDVLGGYTDHTSGNKVNMTSKLSRLDARRINIGVRLISRVTMDQTLSRMSPKEGYDYLKNKYASAAAAARASENASRDNRDRDKKIAKKLRASGYSDAQIRTILAG